MPSELLISIIICTHNRAEWLPQTLAALGKVGIRSGWKAEAILVDNASTDDTAAKVQNTTLRNMTLQYVFEPRKGQSNARNAGLAHARGDVILFTDDDVLVTEDWVKQMVSPLLNGQCEAVTGHFTLAPHLTRTWMSPMHKWWLASSPDAQPNNGTRELIGGNMGFRRSVLERVPAFDPELGPGALGFADDTLFGWQLAQAGFKIEYAPEARAIHQLDATRLRRNHWLADARKRGRTEAYLRYHWEHTEIRLPHLRWLRNFIKLHLRRCLHRPPRLESEGCPLWEISYVLNMAMCKQFCLERERPRNYLQRGLTKRSV